MTNQELINSINNKLKIEIETENDVFDMYNLIATDAEFRNGVLQNKVPSVRQIASLFAENSTFTESDIIRLLSE